ncbi:uncharacterized protein LOC126841446 [Adelges cooleyi]|uniref:uncharacterized protein LOC126841446 n=1 Tax=Adelges cooleyi TaxID=133065 RepID=UPI00218029DF|nr:uncharacterized protein LOC126841446 [Adelges cooleyi]
MKIIWILVSFILVNVLADGLKDSKEDYRQHVFMANKEIKRASEYKKKHGSGLENLIKTLVRQNRSLDELNMMIAMPENMHPDQLQRGAYLQLILRYETLYILPIPEPEPRQGLLENPLKHLFHSEARLTLDELGKARREYTGKAVENIISSGLKYLDDGQEKQFNDIHVCRLIALYTNTELLKNLKDYVKHAEIDDSGLCKLTSTSLIWDKTSYYKQFGDQIFLVSEGEETLLLKPASS